MNYQWYPGHMTKAVRQMQEDIKLVDLVIELLDARIPFSSRNPDINNIAGNKSRIILLNKSDLSDPQINNKWIEFYEKQGISTILINSKDRGSLKRIDELVNKACAEKIERDRKRGILNRPVRAMVVGIPNVGKSTFINSFSGKSSAKTGNKPGVTKGKQWIRLSKTLELLDTPGILWPKFESQKVGENLALIGSINDEILQIEELACALIRFLRDNYKEVLISRYGLDDISDKSEYEIISMAAIKKNCINKGAEPDCQRMSMMLVDDFRSGKFGRLSLEKPEEI